MVNKDLEKEILDQLKDPESRRVILDEYLFDQQEYSSAGPTSKYPANYSTSKIKNYLSCTKGLLRVVGYGFLIFNLEISAILLILSEIVGVIEELK